MRYRFFPVKLDLAGGWDVPEGLPLEPVEIKGPQAEAFTEAFMEELSGKLVPGGPENGVKLDDFLQSVDGRDAPAELNDSVERLTTAVRHWKERGVDIVHMESSETLFEIYRRGGIDPTPAAEAVRIHPDDRDRQYKTETLSEYGVDELKARQEATQTAIRESKGMWPSDIRNRRALKGGLQAITAQLAANGVKQETANPVPGRDRSNTR